MSTITKRNYRATFILDNRGKEDSIDQIIEGVKKDILAVDGEVGAIETLGRRDFVRVTDRNLPGATYIQVAFSAPASGPAALKERLRLNSTVYRTFLQTV
ncbi:MAG: 30S ribosomal protein S6 [Opitutaceae bacterium]|jgi:small subunit ribosomal protein S6